VRGEPPGWRSLEFAALAIDVEAGVAAAGGGVLEDVAADTGDEGSEIGVGAAVEGEVFDFAGTDDLATFAGVGLE
jgi:hypothetical protein